MHCSSMPSSCDATLSFSFILLTSGLSVVVERVILYCLRLTSLGFMSLHFRNKLYSEYVRVFSQLLSSFFTKDMAFTHFLVHGEELEIIPPFQHSPHHKIPPQGKTLEHDHEGGNCTDSSVIPIVRTAHFSHVGVSASSQTFVYKFGPTS